MSYLHIQDKQVLLSLIISYLIVYSVFEIQIIAENINILLYVSLSSILLKRQFC